MQKPRLHMLGVNWPKSNLCDWTFRIKIKMFLDLSSSRNHGHPLRDLQAPDLPNTAGCPRALVKEGPEGRGRVGGGAATVGGALGMLGLACLVTGLLIFLNFPNTILHPGGVGRSL